MHLKISETDSCLNKTNVQQGRHCWGFPDILGHEGVGMGSHQSPSWQADSQAGGCLNLTHMGHVSVIKSCGIQPEPVKLINSVVFP